VSAEQNDILHLEKNRITKFADESRDLVTVADWLLQVS